MLRYLFDTHVLIRWLKAPDELPVKVTNLIRSKNIKYISIVSLWEIVIKQNLKKLDLNYNIDQILVKLSESNVEIISIDYEHLKIYSGLPLHHRDPFDRMLIATSIADKITIVTSDVNIQKYDVDWVWL